MSNLKYNRIASTKSPPVCMKTFSAGLTNLLPHSHDCRNYVSKRMLSCPPIRLHQHTDLRAHYCAHCFYLRHQLGSFPTHTYSFTFRFNCAGQTVPSLHSLACERFYHTRAVKTEGNRSVQFAIQMGAKHFHDVSSQ